MGTRYSHLSLSERHQIARLRDAKVPVAEIARRLDRHVATVHREVRPKPDIGLPGSITRSWLRAAVRNIRLLDLSVAFSRHVVNGSGHQNSKCVRESIFMICCRFEAR
jgi:IS30 family transposase